MLGFPPLPSWDALHPLVVHFPVALLLVAPLLVVLGLLRRSTGKDFLLAALVLMVLGTVAVYVAVPTGEAAGRLAERTPDISKALERHEELAETTRALFTVLTVVFAVILLAPRLLRKELGRGVSLVLNIAFLVLYGAGGLVLANTAHQGGLLVHAHGVHAMVDASPVAAQGAQEASGDRDD